MKTYSQFRPMQYDTAGLGLPERQDWLVAPVSQTRDSGPLERSNFEVVKEDLEKAEPSCEDGDVEVHQFGHWGPGWFEIILVRPNTQAAIEAQEWEDSLADYSIANEDHYSNLEHEECQQTWENCYTDKGRIEFIKEHRIDFEFRSLEDMMGCVRGKHYNGPTSTLLG